MLQKGVGVIALHAVLVQVVEIVRARGENVTDPDSYTHVLQTVEEKEKASRLATARAARAEYTRLAASWSALDPASAWNAQRAVLAASREQLLRAFAGRQADIEQAGRRADLQRYLGSFALDGAGVRGIGRQRLQTLQAYGITTAADISPTALQVVPGIGPVLLSALETWRTSKQRTFRAGAGDRRPPPAAEVRRIDARYADAIGKHLGVLRGGADKLRQVAADGEASLEQARAALLRAARALAQADADFGGAF